MIATSETPPQRASFLPPHLQEQNRRSKEKAARRNREQREENAIRCSDGSKRQDDEDVFEGLLEQIARDFNLQVKPILVPDENFDGYVSAQDVARSIEWKMKERIRFAKDIARRKRNGEPTGTEDDEDEWRLINRLPAGVRRDICIGTKEPKTVTEAEIQTGLALNRENVNGHRNKPRRSRRVSPEPLLPAPSQTISRP